jgi:hypothetical protein
VKTKMYIFREFPFEPFGNIVPDSGRPPGGGGIPG